MAGCRNHSVIAVVELGSNVFRVGIAGEPHPRFVLPVQMFFDEISTGSWAVYTALQGLPPSSMAMSVSTTSSRVPKSPLTAADFRHYFAVIFSRLFLDYLLMTPKECKVLIVEKLHTSTAIRDGILTALLKDLQVC